VRQYYVYILANRLRRTYVGVTNDLQRRVWEHKNALIAGYTRDYGIDRLVFFEQTTDVRVAIAREKQLKRWPRSRKHWLVEQWNPAWADLASGWFVRAGPATM
jgi:putative endonuclease